MNFPLEPIPMPSGGDESSDGASSAGQPPVLPCDVFEPMLGPHLDRELTRAEEARVEAHIDECAKCRARSAHLEALSSVLKSWDVANHEAAAPQERIQNAVLARVAETSHRRRVDDRVLRATYLATAACVLLALGLGLTFGLMWEPALETPDRFVAVGVDVDSDSILSMDVPAPLEMAALPELTVYRDVESLRGAPFDARPLEPVVLQPLEMAHVARVEAFGRRFARERAFEQEVGEHGIHVSVGDGDTRVLSVSAYRFAKARGWINSWRRDYVPAAMAAPIVRPTAEAVPVTEGTPTGLSAVDLLRPMPGLNGLDINALKSQRPIAYWPTEPGTAAVDRMAIRGVPRTSARSAVQLRSSDGSGKPLETIDPIVAQQQGWLRFEESGIEAETLVAFVKGNAKPILLPAGQLLTKGLTDRVIAEPILLPAAPREERRENVPCRVVRVGTAHADGASPVLTDWIAGPAFRALLAQGGSEDGLIRLVEKHVRGYLSADLGAVPNHLGGFSLLEVFENRNGEAETWARRARAAVRAKGSAWRSENYAGFVAVDGFEGLLGIELVSLTGDAGTALLTRLYLGYQLEAHLRTQAVTKRLGEAPVLTDEAFEILARDRTSFVSVRETAQGVSPAQRTSTLEVKRAALAFQAFEIDGQPAVVSVAPVSSR